MARGKSVVIVSASSRGHRARWVELCCELVDADSFTVINVSTMIRILGYEKAFLLAIDDHYFSAICLVAIRYLLGRKTSALVLAPQFVRQATTLRQIIKRFTLRAVSKLKLVEIYACGVGYEEECEDPFKRLADLNLVDLSILPIMPCCPPELMNLSEAKLLVASVGVQRSEKMPELFMKSYIESAYLRKQLVFGLFGEQRCLDLDVLKAFRAVGGIIIDRHLSESELIWIEERATLLWGLYNSVYDQSSGVFGHAVQLGKPCLVRQGSRLERAQSRLGYRLVALPTLPSIIRAIQAAMDNHEMFRPVLILETGKVLIKQWHQALDNT